MPARPFRLAAALAALAVAFAADVGDAVGARGHRGHSASGKLVWADEFDGPAGAPPDPAKWGFDVGGGGWGNRELEYYTSRPANASLDGHGHLAITAREEPFSGQGVTRAYTSARLKTEGRFAIAFGRIEASIEIPSGRGLWPAFWALGEDIETAGWPASGEIDVMESLGDDPFTAYGSIHGPRAGRAGDYSITAPYRSDVSLAAGFHSYGVKWSPSSIAFTVDGAVYATRTPTQLARRQRWVFDKPFFLLLNLAVGGDWPGAPGAMTPFPATMLVDWVRVYSG